MVEIYLPKQEGKLLAVGLRGDLQLPDDVRILKDAEKELENAIHHLERSNEELREEDPNDEVYRSALEENAEALVKKRDRLRRIREKIAALTGGLPTCTNTGRPSSGLSPGDSECGPAVTEDSYRSSANRIPSTHGASEGSQRPDQSATTPRHSASTDSRGAGVQLLLGADADTETRDEPEGKREVSFSLSQERRSEERSRSHTEHDGSIFL